MITLFKLAMMICLCVFGCLIGYAIYDYGKEYKFKLHKALGVIIAIGWIIGLIICLAFLKI